MAQKTRGSLTEGPILKVLTGLALPIMASSFLSTLYSITDMAWIGELGARAVAGVGVGGMYTWLSQGLSSLARMGGQVHVAQCLGRGEREEAKSYGRASIQMVLLFGIVFGLICLLFTAPLVDFFGIKEAETVKYAREYLRIVCGLILFSYVNVTLTGLFTAQGDSRTPFWANLVGLVMNMIFDPVLILGLGPFPRMEVKGAAVATVGAQMVVTAVLLFGIARSEKGNILKELSLFRKTGRRYFRGVIRVGGPTALQGSVYCMISMVLTRMVAGFGSGAVATQRVGGQIESISWNTADGFAAAINAFVGQNFGAGKMKRVREGYRISFNAMAAWGAVVTLIFVVFPTPIARVFFHEPEVIPVAVGYLRIVGISEAFMCVEMLAIGAISGFGTTKVCSMISIVLTGMRIPLAMMLCGSSLGLKGIWWALTVTSIAKGIVLHLTFLRQCGRYEKKM